MRYKENPEMLKKKLIEQVVEYKWERMIAHWQSEEAKKVDKKVAANRALKTMKHHSGICTVGHRYGPRWGTIIRH